VTVFQEDMLKDRAIFLTGGGTGLGRSMALHFAMLGALMFLMGRREQHLKDVCDEIHRLGNRCELIRPDGQEQEDGPIGVAPHELVSYAAKDLETGVDTLLARGEELLAKFPDDPAWTRAKVPYVPADFGWK